MNATNDPQIAAMIPEFLRNCRDSVRKLKRAIALGDTEKIICINTGFKGVALPLGFTVLDMLSDEMRKNYKNPGHVMWVTIEIEEYIEREIRIRGIDLAA